MYEEHFRLLISTLNSYHNLRLRCDLQRESEKLAFRFCFRCLFCLHFSGPTPISNDAGEGELLLRTGRCAPRRAQQCAGG
jgi:hypothetical protein